MPRDRIAEEHPVDTAMSTDTVRNRLERVAGVVTPNGWSLLAVAVATTGLGVVADYRELLAPGLALLALFAVACLWLLARPSIEGRRVITPSRVQEGESAHGVLTLRNVGSRRAPMLTLQERVGADTVEASVRSLAPGAEQTVSYPLPTEQRGRHVVGPLRLGHTDPFRIVRAGRSQGGCVTLFVHPRSHEVPALPTGRARDLEGLQSRRTSRGGVSFHTLREYVPGDDLRFVHWRSTARTGTLMVRHNVVTDEPRFSVLLDTAAASYDTDERFEDAVRVAASWVRAGVEHGNEVEFRTTSGLHGHIDGTGVGHHRVLDLMAQAETTKDDPGLAELARLVDTRRVPVSLGIVTGHPRAGQSEIVARATSRFDSVSIVQLADRPGATPLRIDGALVLHCSGSEDFVRTWKQRVG